MKTLASEKVTLSADGKSVTITANIEDLPFNGMLVTRVTHVHVNPDNVKHGRAIQSSNEAVFIRSRAAGVALPNDFIARIAATIEPLTSFPPVIQKGSLGKLNVTSELPVTYQWQISDDAFPKGTFPPPEPVWTDIMDATNAELDEATISDGKWVRCIVTNGAGKVITQPAQKLAPKPVEKK